MKLHVAAALLAAAAVLPAQTLKEAFHDTFRVGAAINRWQAEERDPLAAPLIPAQFNTVTPENDMKWERIHPRPGTFDFGPADTYAAYARKNGMFAVGHCLIWHSQTPKWVFEDEEGKPLTRDALLARMRDHIQTVMTRYKGRISGWDVVNEALDEDGTLRNSPWRRIIGDDFIQKAFEFAHAADPDAELYYNDYSLESEAKGKGAVRLIKQLKAAGATVTGVGLQGHYKIDWPSAQRVAETIEAFRPLGVQVHITELDVDVLPRTTATNSADVANTAAGTAAANPYKDGLPPEMQKALADRYAELFKIFASKHDIVRRVTFWGVTDAGSWLNNFPTRGRTNYPLLFDRQGRPKPAFYAVTKSH